MRRSGIRASACFWLLLAGSVVALPAAEPAEVSTELKVERGLLALDLLALKEERTREDKARGRVVEIYGRLDRSLRAESVSQGALESLSAELRAARSVERDSSERIALQLERIQEHLRRVALLEAEAKGSITVPDLLTGRWRLRVQPPDRSGVLELRLAGSVVTGTYRFDLGGTGSVRGTFAEGKIHLERIDSSAGFDAVFDGKLKNQTLEGTWSANELAAGNPTRGEWSATKDREQ